MDKDKIYLDEEGYKEQLASIEEVKEKLRNLEKEKTEGYYAAVGDGWHDNFAYEDAVRQERMLFNELDNRKEELSRIMVIKRGKNSNIVDIEDIVTLEIDFNNDVDRCTYKLVAHKSKSDDEISINSPLGKAIYKKKYGSNVEYRVKDNTFKVHIIEKTDMTTKI